VNNNLKWHLKKNITLAVPVMMGQLGQVMVGVADNIMVGHVGKAPLAAASLANSLFVIVMVFGIGSSFAISPMTAQAQGENDLKKISSILKNAVWVNGGLGIVLSVMVIFLSFLIPYLDQPGDVAELAAPYLRIIGVSLLPLLIFQAYRQFSEGLSLTVPPMIIIVGTNILNIIFNYILIYGKLGFPAMGLLGAGIATLIARIVMVLMIITVTFSNRRYKKWLVDLKQSYISIKWIKSIMALGFPMGLQFTFEVTAFALAAIMIGWLGATELAAHQIAINLAAVTFMAASGIGSAASIRVGNQMGKRDYTTMRKAAITSYGMVILFMSLTATLFITLRNFLPHIYISNAEVIAQASSLLIVAAVFQISDGVQVVGLGILRGMSDVKIPTIITLVAYWGTALPVGYLLGFKAGWGAEGVWIGLLLGLSVAAVLLFMRFHRISHSLVQKRV